jgi:hypothetical protein
MQKIRLRYKKGMRKDGGHWVSSAGTIVKLSKAYMAGFFDGEGCVNIAKYKNGCYVRVLLVNTNREVLEAFRSCYGGNITEGSNYKIRKNWKKSWTWRLSYQKAVDFLMDMYPWILVKEAQVLTALTWAKARPGKGKRWDAGAAQLLFDRMAWLNRKGPRHINEIDPIIPVLEEMELKNAVKIH